jgi:hypothetical protein
MEPIIERVERLERSLIFWRIGAVCLLLVCFGISAARLTAAPDELEARIITAQEFNLVDHGRVLARLVGDPTNPNGGGGLVLMYPDQKPALGIQLDDKFGPAVALYDDDGSRGYISIRLDQYGPAIDLKAASGKKAHFAILNRDNHIVWEEKKMGNQP